MISIIVAMSNGQLIGKEGELPWNLPADLKHFRELTENHAVIMGRKTFESIGRPLPNRMNIVISRNPDFWKPDITIARSFNEALVLARAYHNDEAFVIGGAEVYREAMQVANKIYLTRIDAWFEGDTFFPEIDTEKWEVSECFLAGEDAFPYYFITMIRKKTTPNQ